MTNEAQAQMTRGVVYPRFLGVDEGGDFVWELANGRWTWGVNPYDAATKQRTLTPDRYEEKYGPVEVPEPFFARAIEVKPTFPGAAPVASISRDLDGTVTKTIAETHPGNQGANQALAAMLRMLDSWIDGARDNHEALGHRHENTGEECWRTFAPDDIRRMVNDVAREMGLAEFPAPPHPEEDKPL